MSKAIRAHTFSDEKDTAAICALLAQARAPAWQGDYPGANDLRELLAEPVVQNNTRLWQDERGELVAYALVDEFNNLRFDALPASQNPALDAEIFAWGAEAIRRRNVETNADNTLDAVCRAEDVERIAWLERFGFTRQPFETIYMQRVLDEPIPSPALPDGFAIRAVSGEDEAEALAALHRAAFGTEHMTSEKRLVWMRAPHYDAALDLVAVTPDGELAAYCFGRIDHEEIARSGRREGWLDPVATHPRYQGRGLARALLLRGLDVLRARGMEYGILGTSSANLAMQRAAFAAGFCVESKRVWFSKSV